jgi:Nif-specific regulatory protein
VLGALYLGRSEADGPFGEEELQLVTALGRLATPPLANLRRLAALQQDTERLQADLGVNFNLVGDSPAMRTAFARITRIAPSDVPVLVLGETGTGKELAARAVHANSRRARRPFVAINCAALAETLLESELFGHERGAFTGAVGQKRGKLEVADGGTLFLDEVGELTPAAQGKLLRVLQEHEFERVGGTRPIRIDIRLISATNRVLTDEVAAGRFRQDLYFRLSVVSVQMPPLRERKGDIALLARHFLARFGRATGRRVSGFSADAVQRLTAYSWPGNVRELENVVQRAAVLSAADEIGIDDLPEDVIQVPTGALGRDDDLDFHGAVIRTKKRVILAAFRKAGGSYVETARLLHVHPNYLHRLIRNLELKGELEDSRP